MFCNMFCVVNTLLGHKRWLGFGRLDFWGCLCGSISSLPKVTVNWRSRPFIPGCLFSGVLILLTWSWILLHRSLSMKFWGDWNHSCLLLSRFFFFKIHLADRLFFFFLIFIGSIVLLSNVCYFLFYSISFWTYRVDLGAVWGPELPWVLVRMN